MPLPNVSFKEFIKNPIVALLFMCLMAIGYLYIDNRATLTAQVEDLQEEVKDLKEDNKELNNKIIDILSTIDKKNN